MYGGVDEAHEGLTQASSSGPARQKGGPGTHVQRTQGAVSQGVGTRWWAQGGLH